nr:5050_t:CDS:2 [Entrophospora candida]
MEFFVKVAETPGILGGINHTHMVPKSKVLCLDAASGGWTNVAKERTNVIPIIEDARHPYKYHMLVGMVFLPQHIL